MIAVRQSARKGTIDTKFHGYGGCPVDPVLRSVTDHKIHGRIAAFNGVGVLLCADRDDFSGDDVIDHSHCAVELIATRDRKGELWDWLLARFRFCLPGGKQIAPVVECLARCLLCWAWIAWTAWLVSRAPDVTAIRVALLAIVACLAVAAAQVYRWHVIHDILVRQARKHTIS